MKKEYSIDVTMEKNKLFDFSKSKKLQERMMKMKLIEAFEILNTYTENNITTVKVNYKPVIPLPNCLKFLTKSIENVVEITKYNNATKKTEFEVHPHNKPYLYKIKGKSKYNTFSVEPNKCQLILKFIVNINKKVIKANMGIAPEYVVNILVKHLESTIVSNFVKTSNALYGSSFP